ncbi:MAG: antitoxin family protein [Desulfurococcales archaeon]|nr:antitoxin family protein [Desulfurococcales archaeon]
MPLKTIAIYREGYLKPLEPLDLKEGETVIVVARHSIGFIEKFIKDQTSLTSIIFKKIPATKAALAKWEDNSLKPLEPLDLQEGETILIEILKTSSSIAEKIPGSIVYIEEDPIKILSSERR